MARFSLLFEIRNLRRNVSPNPQFVNICAMTRIFKTVFYPFNGQQTFYVSLDFPINMAVAL